MLHVSDQKIVMRGALGTICARVRCGCATPFLYEAYSGTQGVAHRYAGVTESIRMTSMNSSIRGVI